YREGAAVGPNAWEVDGDVFVEVRLGPAELDAGKVAVAWAGHTHEVRVAETKADVTFARLPSLEHGGDLLAVLIRSRGLRRWLRGLLVGSALEVAQLDAEAESPS